MAVNTPTYLRTFHDGKKAGYLGYLQGDNIEREKNKYPPYLSGLIDAKSQKIRGIWQGIIIKALNQPKTPNIQIPWPIFH